MEGSLEQTTRGEFGEVGMVGRGRSASERGTLTRGGGGECSGEAAALSVGCVEGEVVGSRNGGSISATREGTVNAVEGQDGSSGGLNGQDGWEGEDLNRKGCSSNRGGELPALEGGAVRGGGEKRRRCATASGGEFLGEGEASTRGRTNGKLQRGEKFK